MGDPRAEERIRELAGELHALLNRCLELGPERNDAEMARAKKVRAEIESYGYPVLWSFSFDTTTFEPQATVTVLQPKEDLSPEDQALYDKWFLGRTARGKGPA